MRRLVALAVALTALAAPALAQAAPPIARPNPATYPVTLDYTNPLPSPSGTPATVAPLGKGIIVAATTDRQYLQYQLRGDLGGFVPAPVGALALSSGGHDVLLPGKRKTQIPLFQQAAGGKISSFTFTGVVPTPPSPPDNGQQPVPGIGVPPQPPAPTGENTVPPANQGFGGKPGGGGNGETTTTEPGGTTTGGEGGGGTTTGAKPPPTTTTTTAATTTTGTTTTTETATTTATTTTTSGGGGGSGGGSGGSSCGVAGLKIVSSAAGCVISIANAAPGDSTSELMTITNTSDTPYTVSLKVEGPNDNHLWQDLQLAVWDTSGAPPGTFPSLQSWMSGFNDLLILNPGQSVQLEIELYLPTTAGNADQGETAVVAFHWHAQG